MTAFNPGQIPASVATIEQLAAWAISALTQINAGSAVATDSNTLEPPAQAQTFRLANQSDNPERFVGVVYLPLTANWRANGSIFAGGVGELSSSALPVEFQS